MYRISNKPAVLMIKRKINHHFLYKRAAFHKAQPFQGNVQIITATINQILFTMNVSIIKYFNNFEQILLVSNKIGLCVIKK